MISGIEKMCYNTRIEELKRNPTWLQGREGEKKCQDMRLRPGCGEASKTIVRIQGYPIGTIGTRV